MTTKADTNKKGANGDGKLKVTAAKKDPGAEETQATSPPATTAEGEKKGKAKKEKAPKEPKPEKTAHMAKVDAAAKKLPTMSGDADEVFEQAKKLTTGEISVLIAHLTVETRRRLTAEASKSALSKGDRVRITSSSQARYFGLEGTVSRVQRIRCFVDIPGFDNPAYLFCSDVTVIGRADASQQLTSDDITDASSSDEADEAANG